MKPPSAYKLLLSECTLAPTSPLTSLSFKITTSTSSKLVKPFSFPTRNQHFNCQLLIFQSNPNIQIQFLPTSSSPSTLPTLKPQQIDLSKPKQIVDLIDKSNQKHGSLTVQIQILSEPPNEKQKFYINNVKIEFTLGMAPKKQLFVLIKQGDTHIRTQQTNVREEYMYQWREEHEFDPEEPHQNIYIECWEDNDEEYIGTAVVNIQKSLNKLTKYPLKDIKDIEIGMVCIKLFDEENFKKEIERSSMLMRPLKIYVLEAVLNKQLNGKTHTYINVYLEGGDRNKLATTSVFSEDRNPKWNQSFQIVVREEEYLRFELCERGGRDEGDEEEEIVLGVGMVETEGLEDEKKQIHLESKVGEVGKLYIEVQSKEPKREDHKSPASKLNTTSPKQKIEQKPHQPQPKSPSPKQPSRPSPKHADLFKPQPPQNHKSSRFSNSQTLQQLKQMKAKYTGKTMYQYYNDQLNDALREGLLMVAKDKPTDPIRELGLFLMNYKR